MYLTYMYNAYMLKACAICAYQNANANIIAYIDWDVYDDLDITIGTIYNWKQNNTAHATANSMRERQMSKKIRIEWKGS